ncbi:hypothetical protein J2X31_000647 [Flavobacterium arsenatis]|uniref:Lipoprotein n=1 Tax=Flavobacterium arsenatis TaxID=1484332 RepID=A0ABU1TKZ3_9FLAO|nr:hypothetical protein [Flavobacterium arsenatis]MDR6966649.1 hypothetical protein [Flavobacterium arsenatis]
MKYFSLLFFLLLFTSCKKDPKNIDPNAYLTAEAQEEFKYSIIRHADRLVKKATHQTKFDSIFDEEYKEKAESSNLLYYYIDKQTGVHYFALTKIAPSLIVKRVATVGKIEYDKEGGIASYEEGFRTWKMEEPELNEKTATLFEKYIEGEDLSSYYTANSKGEFYIEFPDDKTYYDKEERLWKNSQN